MLRGLGACVASLFVAVGCGKLEFGNLDGGGEVPDVPDVGMIPDVPVPDVPDIGPEDVPDQGGCLDPAVPDYPTALNGSPWPFATTGYEAYFWNPANDPGSCTAGACHGDPMNPMYGDPIIPTAGMLSSRVTDAIDAMWTLAQLSTVDPATMPQQLRGPMWAHVPGGASENTSATDKYPYSPGDRQFIIDFINAAAACHLKTWIENFSEPLCSQQMPPDSGPADAGDGGEGDGGDAADAGVDSGAMPTECYCDLPPVPTEVSMNGMMVPLTHCP